LFAVMQAGDQQAPFGNIGRSDPTDQRQQQNGALMRTPPQPEGVLLVTDKPAALAGLERASAQGRAGRCVSARVFFLKPLQDAGRSVASMRAVAPSQSAAVWTSGSSSTSLICRSPSTPVRTRNAWRMRTSGTWCRWRSRAKERQARCSGSMATKRLNECTGVSSVSRCTRQSCAALNDQRGPRSGRAFHCSLINWSGTYGSSNASKSEVPVNGSEFMPLQTTHSGSLRPTFPSSHSISSQPTVLEPLT
jgi:hypothetical protein